MRAWKVMSEEARAEAGDNTTGGPRSGGHFWNRKVGHGERNFLAEERKLGKS